MEYWVVVKAILKYLRRTKDLVLTYGGGDLQLTGFTDSDFQSDVDDRKSISRFFFTCNGGAVSWKSSKKSITANSTTKAKYIATSDAAKEAIWIKKFIIDLGVVPFIKPPVPLYCDNNVAIALAIGSLMYAMLCIRPDIAYTVSVTSRFQSNPGLEQWVAVKSIFK